MSSSIDEYSSPFNRLGRMGRDAAIPEGHKAPALLASIDPNRLLESNAAALRAKVPSEMTLNYVETRLTDGYYARESSLPRSNSTKNTYSCNIRWDRQGPKRDIYYPPPSWLRKRFACRPSC